MKLPKNKFTGIGLTYDDVLLVPSYSDCPSKPSSDQFKVFKKYKIKYSYCICCYGYSYRK